MRKLMMILVALMMGVGLSAGSSWGAAVLMSTEGNDPQVFGDAQGHTIIGDSLATLLDPDRLYNKDNDGMINDTIFDFDVFWVSNNPDYNALRTGVADGGTLEQFVSQGGVIVIAAGVGSGLQADIAPGGVDYTRTTTQLSATINNPTHPYITGADFGGVTLTQIDFEGWGGTSFGILSDLIPGSTVLLGNDIAEPTWVTYSWGLGNVIVTSLTYGFNCDGSGTTCADPDRDNALANLFNYAAFLSEGPVDSDGDGLIDTDEVDLGTDPGDPDTDDDGLEDGEEVNDFGTNPLDADSDDDGSNDGNEITLGTDPLDADSDDDLLLDGQESTLGTDPLDPDTDADGLDDGEEVNTFGTNPLDSDSDDDLLSDSVEVNLAAGSGCPSPTDFDSDDDTLDDGLEFNSLGTNLCNPDTDGDGLSDGNEFDLGTDPLDDDTDNDGLIDGDEVILGTDPFDPDSDDDGLSDGEEGASGADPLDPDSDDDGLNDGVEEMLGTDLLDPDTDDDGALDGVEIDIAMGTGCPDPLVADSDNDSLSDGDEIDLLDTNPCDADTDGDGLTDNVDPTPTVPGATSGFLEDAVRDLADLILSLDLALFNGPNNNANSGRRNSLANRASGAAKQIAKGNFEQAIEKLESLLQKIDGESPPKDWMHDTLERQDLEDEVLLLIDLLAYEL
jgi:hypothetical protein